MWEFRGNLSRWQSKRGNHDRARTCIWKHGQTEWGRPVLGLQQVHGSDQRPLVAGRGGRFRNAVGRIYRNLESPSLKIRSKEERERGICTTADLTSASKPRASCVWSVTSQWTDHWFFQLVIWLCRPEPNMFHSGSLSPTAEWYRVLK